MIPQTSKSDLLQVENLITKFETIDGTVHAVNSVSFHVKEGETLGIVGESGCGKSVSMLSVMRLLPQPPATIEADRIDFLGKDLLNMSEPDMRELRGEQIAMVFQDPMTSLNPVLTIGFQLTEPMRLHHGMQQEEANDHAVELLNLVGIPEARSRLNDYPNQFSGGMRQRAMIAMGLACNPLVLIADEPTTALDVTIQAQIIDLVVRLREQFGMALIWITHDLGVIARVAERVQVMYAGYLVEVSSVDALFYNPRHPYTVGLLQSIPHLESEPGKKLHSIEGLPPDLIDLPVGCPFVPRCPYAKDICRQQMPPQEEVSSEHIVACWVDIDTGKLR